MQTPNRGGILDRFNYRTSDPFWIRDDEPLVRSHAAQRLSGTFGHAWAVLPSRLQVKQRLATRRRKRAWKRGRRVVNWQSLSLAGSQIRVA